MSEEQKQERNTDKKRIAKLEGDLQILSERLNKLTIAIRNSAHVMGWPRDLLERQGIKAFEKGKDKLEVNGRG